MNTMKIAVKIAFMAAATIPAAASCRKWADFGTGNNFIF